VGWTWCHGWACFLSASLLKRARAGVICSGAPCAPDDLADNGVTRVLVPPLKIEIVRLGGTRPYSPDMIQLTGLDETRTIRDSYSRTRVYLGIRDCGGKKLVAIVVGELPEVPGHKYDVSAGVCSTLRVQPACLCSRYYDGDAGMTHIRASAVETTIMPARNGRTMSGDAIYRRLDLDEETW